MDSMAGKVVVVTGASRGAGRGIASVLGEAGAIVYVTGRSVRGDLTKPALLGTTIEDTADLVTTSGGVGIPVRVDHTVDAEIESLFEQVKRDHGRLDLLVNNAWGGYEDYAYHGGDPSVFDAVFWEQPIERWDKMWQAGVRATLATTKAALPLMFAQREGLIINTTLEIDPTFYDAALYYRTAKLAINYLTYGMAHDIYRRGRYPIPVLGLALGWMRTEAVMENFRQGLHPAEELKQTDSVELGGRAVLALATDPYVLQKTGKIWPVRALAQEYGFGD
ncbi:MAG TPA: SDR family NAD(P)-dependent oxidoreductase [Anaerolineales bacterium]|jgi:NAD(P)-dependent dehydrogenase (short-subunit alcohol dehydrogenase family)|nr:SDR family NAD(P)-dependent oxidoreductase [Anaerolineales bacterium]